MGEENREEPINKEDILDLMQSYRLHFQFETGLKKGIEAFNLAAEELLPADIDKIREILACISDQFSLMPPEGKESRMNTLKNRIGELASIRSDDVQKNEEINQVICQIFKSLSELPPSSEIRFKVRRVYVC
jgi:hypothetical protein